jgi:4-hydroxythreonine-4-phosphate dehydrogenase
MRNPPLIAVSAGDPGGIGPEVIAGGLADADLRGRARWLLIGARVDGAPVTFGPTPPAGPTRAGEVACWSPELDGPRRFEPRPNAEAGRVSLAWVRAAIAAARREVGPGLHADAVVTGPICKEAWVLAGESRYPGHTELFAEAFHAPGAAMMFAAEPAVGGGKGLTPFGMNVILATAHVPLSEVPRALTTQRVLEVIRLGESALRRMGIARVRIGVCGLNPHAGEGGILGHEDARVIAPAVAAARGEGLDAVGPLPADTLFGGALCTPDAPPARFDLVVAMYHDQGLIPLKLAAFDRAVNLTVGLTHAGRAIVRTSPDHGTAFDLVGRSQGGASLADPGSMAAAMRLAIRLAASAEEPPRGLA